MIISVLSVIFYCTFLSYIRTVKSSLSAGIILKYYPRLSIGRSSIYIKEIIRKILFHRF